MKEMTIKDLLVKNSCFCVHVSVNKDYWLFIEGLSDNGEAITNDFNILLVKNVIVEIIHDYDIIDTIEAKLSTKLSTLINQAEKQLKQKKGEENGK